MKNACVGDIVTKTKKGFKRYTNRTKAHLPLGIAITTPKNGECLVLCNGLIVIAEDDLK